MRPVDESPTGGDGTHFQAEASDQARIYQAGRDQYVSDGDLHLHYQADVRRARRVEAGVKPAKCPYPGLLPFDAAQARWFFGRDALIADLLVRLDEQLRQGGTLAVVAPSGAGKSSVLRAGLLPAIARGALPVAGSAQWPSVLMTPTGHPINALATQLAKVISSSPDQVDEMLLAPPTVCAAIVREALQRQVDSQEDSARRLVIVVDQLEELFTLCEEEDERCRFLSVLAALAAPGDGGSHPAALVVYGLRSDFYAQCANYPELRAALQNDQVLVGPLSEEGLREAIQYPAQDAGLEIEPGLIELLLRDLGLAVRGDAGGIGGAGRYEAGRLPLLAHALRATWQQKSGNILTVDGYRATGGIGHAIATTAENRFNRLDPESKQAAQVLFLRLVKIGEGVDDTRRRVHRSEILSSSGNPAMFEAVIDTFTEGRLLTQNHETVEITHEALLHAWPRLSGWIDADRAGNIIRQDLEEATAGWVRNRNETGALYRGSRLESACAWAATVPNNSLAPDVSAFLAASVRQKRRRRRRRSTVIAILSALTLVASMAAVVAFQQRDTARSERDKAIYLQIVAEADALRASDPSLAAQLDLVAYRMRPTADLQTQLINDAGRTLSIPLEHDREVASVEFSPDGKTLAGASYDGKVWLWDLSSPGHPKRLRRLQVAEDHLAISVTFSHDGKILAGSAGNKIVLWDLSERTRPKTLGNPVTGHGDITSMAFSPDGRVLASASTDRTVRLWSLADPAQAVPLSKPIVMHADEVNSVEFSPNGRILASGSRDGTVQLWNLADPIHPASIGKPLTGHGSPVWSARFSPDGRTLASAGADGNVRLWDVRVPARPVPKGKALSHPSIVESVAFAQNGRILATACDDGLVRLWDISGASGPMPLGEWLAGHDGPVGSVAFSPDGYTIASASQDGTIRLWSRPRTVLTGHSGSVLSVEFSPDGSTLASGSSDTTVRLWNIADPAHPVPLGEPLAGHDGAVVSVAFSPDGRTLASASYDKTVQLWDVADLANPKRIGKPLLGHADIVTSVRFSPDGRTLATASQDKTVRLWDLTDVVRPRPLGKPIDGHMDGVWALAFSPKGRILATASNDVAVRLWDITDPGRIKQLGNRMTSHAAPVGAVSFSPDGRLLVSGGSDNTVRLWNVSDPVRPKLISALAGFNGTVSSALFSPDGKYLAAASEDSNLRLWDARNPAVPLRIGRPLTGHIAGVHSLDISADGKTLASGSDDFTVRIWRLEGNANSLKNQICQSTRGALTRGQWKDHIPQLPFNPPCL
ncbi:NACHT and WD repeat domain-containing protein [Streptomyces sp. NPDC002566]|uniref:NACHT and WD repeat domain-containing protein n=1 Tax=Streptomyces sp. NPDC002566 TaxID=3364650 RepID=UPI0036A8F620